MSEVSQKVLEYKAAIKALKPFDLSCCFPPIDYNSLGKYNSKEEIINGLSAFGIEKAAFWNMDCTIVSPIAGNEETIQAIKGHDNCYLCAVLAPDMDMKEGDLEKYLDYYAENKLVAARMFPTKLVHSMQDWCVGNILKALEKRGIPLILWHTEVSWDTVASIATRYPNLKIVIEAIEKKMLYHSKNQAMLVKNFKNIYFASYNLGQYGILEALNTAEDCRVVLASNYPVSEPNMSFGVITEANISEETKAYICHGFAEEILNK